MQNIGKKRSKFSKIGILTGLLVFLLLTSCRPKTPEEQKLPTKTNNTGTSAPVETLALPTATFTPLSSPASTPSVVPDYTQTQTPPQQAAGLPAADNYLWEPLASGLSQPIGVYYTPAEPRKVYIIEQAGVIRILEQSSLLPDPFLDIRSQVGSQESEQGLLGLAFHPQYPQTPYFYVNYTDTSGNTVISRFNVNSGEPPQVDPASEKVLLRVEQPYPNHNGGELVFGPDGYLYLGLGDGGSAGDPQGNAQSTQTLLGKILRIDVDRGDPYTIPADNPFVNGGGKGEIWAYGLRNPWRFSFDRQTHAMYIGDVGQNSWEEVDYLPPGAPPGSNFGWSYFEGTHPYKGSPPGGLEFIQPVYEYGHDEGCSITGGVVYRGSQLPEWQGVYLFGDYCSGTIWGMLLQPDGNWQVQRMFTTHANITSFGEDATGEVYMADHGGNIFTLARKP